MGSDEFKRFEFQYGLILVRTKRFQPVMDRMGAARITKPVGWVLLYAMPVAAALGFYLFLTELSVLLSSRGAEVAHYVRTLGPLANLGLPGINPYLPIVDGWIALLIAIVIHEGAHGVVARSLGLPVKASGLLFFLFVPIGAFVDVDDVAIKEARASHSGRVLAAGAGVNLIVGVISLLLLIFLVSGMAPAADGIPIYQVNVPSPAATAGLHPGDFILSVNGVSYTEGAQILNSSWDVPGSVVNVTVLRQESTVTFPLTIGGRPSTAVECAAPMAVGVSSVCRATISGYLGNITGEQVSFESSGQGTFNMTSCSIAVDACSVEYVPAAAPSAPENITAGYQGDARNMWSLGFVLVQVDATPGGGSTPLGNPPPGQGAGVTPATGPGWLGIESINLQSLRDIASGYAAPLQNPWKYVCIPTLPQCQVGVPFSDSMKVFYTSPLGPATGAVANLLYWLFFLNFNLAIFNALPIYPLDGGQAFAVGVKALGRGKLSEGNVMRITTLSTLVVLGLLLGIIAGPWLF